MMIWRVRTKQVCFFRFGVSSSSKRLLSHLRIRCCIVSSDGNKSRMVVWLLSSYHPSGHRTTCRLRRVLGSSFPLNCEPCQQGGAHQRVFSLSCVPVCDEWGCWRKLARAWKWARSSPSLSFNKMIQLSIWGLSKGHLHPIMTHFLFLCDILRLENSYKWDFFNIRFLNSGSD